MSVFRISRACIENRGYEGLSDFIHDHTRDLIASAIKRGDTGTYRLTFVKIRDLDEDDQVTGRQE